MHHRLLTHAHFVFYTIFCSRYIRGLYFSHAFSQNASVHYSCYTYRAMRHTNVLLTLANYYGFLLLLYSQHLSSLKSKEFNYQSYQYTVRSLLKKQTWCGITWYCPYNVSHNKHPWNDNKLTRLISMRGLCHALFHIQSFSIEWNRFKPLS